MSEKVARAIMLGLGLMLGAGALFLAGRYLLPWTAPLLTAWALAALLEPAVSFLTRRRWRRGAAAGLCTLAALGLILWGLSALIVKGLAAAGELTRALPSLMQALSLRLGDLEDVVEQHIRAVPAPAAGLLEKMTRPTALLLIAAILDNTLDLTSANTTPEDRAAFETLCVKAGVGEDFRADYFSAVQRSVEADLETALLKDVKTVRSNPVLPEHVAQIAVWDADRILEKLPTIRAWFGRRWDSWMINVIDISRRRSTFVCDDRPCQRALESIFDVRFTQGVADCRRSYLRKEILKTVQEEQAEQAILYLKTR